MRILICTGLGFLLALPHLLPGGGPTAVAGGGGETDRGQVCATGCAVDSGEIGGLTAAEIEGLFEELGEGSLDGENLALETLLFHGAQIGEALDELDGVLDAESETFLRRELARQHARLDVRFVDENGSERLRLGARRIPLGEKQHLFPSRAQALTPPEISGTVRRVGLDHLWVRLLIVGDHLVAGPWFTVQESGTYWEDFDVIWISNGEDHDRVRVEMRVGLAELVETR
jgi:hypothetical protein